jgi:hypothetical protein
MLTRQRPAFYIDDVVVVVVVVVAEEYADWPSNPAL